MEKVKTFVIVHQVQILAVLTLGIAFLAYKVLVPQKR